MRVVARFGCQLIRSCRPQCAVIGGARHAGRGDVACDREAMNAHTAEPVGDAPKGHAPQARSAAPAAGAHLVLLSGAPLTAEAVARMTATLAAEGFYVLLTPSAGTPVAAAGDAADAEARAYARGEARLRAWTRGGTLVNCKLLARQWHLTRQGLGAARERGELFSLWIQGEHWYPAEALKFQRRDFAAVNAALGAREAPASCCFYCATMLACKASVPPRRPLPASLR